MQPQRRREDSIAAEFPFHQSNVVEMSRRVGTVGSRLFSVPPASAFHSYDNRCRQRHQFGCDTAENQTDDCGEYNRSRNDRTDDGGSGREGADADDDHVAPLTPRKHDYSVAELLRRDDRPSCSGRCHEVGPSDGRRHNESTTTPSQTADSAFRCWTGKQAATVRTGHRVPPPLDGVDSVRRLAAPRVRSTPLLRSPPSAVGQ